MNKRLAERAIIANRPDEPFVLVERVDGDEIADLSALDWQAPTTPPTWDQVVAWTAALAAVPVLPARGELVDHNGAPAIVVAVDAAAGTVDVAPLGVPATVPISTVTGGG